MIKILSAAIFMLLCATAHTQPPAPISQEINDSVVARFNRGDFKAIWDMGTDSWKKTFPKNDFAGYMDYLKTRAGLIDSSLFFADSGNYKYYKWVGAKKTLILGLNVPLAQVFNDINFAFFISPAELSAILKDNPLKNSIDSNVHSLATRFMVENSAVGLSIGIVKDDKIYTYNYGTVEKGKLELPTDRTLYDLGSTLKTFTGILLAQAVIDKKAALTDDIRKYLPGDYPNLAYEGHPIRLVDLANYTSGMPDGNLHNMQNISAAEQRLFMTKYTVAEFLDDFHHAKLNFIPGTKYQYSSNAVALLAAILQRIYGMSYAELVQKFIAHPMHLKDTRVTTASEKDTSRFAKGYDADGQRYWNYGPVFELGGIHSTVHDMLVYIRQNIQETNPAVKLAHQQTTQLGVADEESGLGWFIEPTIRGIQLEKGGNSPRHSSDCVLIREKNIGIICFTNMRGLELRNLSEDILGKLLGGK